MLSRAADFCRCLIARVTTGVTDDKPLHPQIVEAAFCSVFFASDERADALARLATLIDGIVNPRDKRAVIEWCAGPLMRAAPPAVWQPEAKITRQRQRTHLGQAALAFSYFQARWRAFPKDWRQIAGRDCR